MPSQTEQAAEAVHAAAHVIPFLTTIGESYRLPALAWTVTPDGELHGQPADADTAARWASAFDQRLHDTGQRGVWAVSSPFGIADVTVRLASAGRSE